MELLFFLIGIHDDICKSSPLLRLLLQFVVAFFVSLNGINLGAFNFSLPYFGQINLVLIPIINHIISAFWIVGITNAINWIDGIDALAEDTAQYFLLVCVLMFLQGNTIGIFFYSIFLGSILGFLIRKL